MSAYWDLAAHNLFVCWPLRRLKSKMPVISIHVKSRISKQPGIQYLLSGRHVQRFDRYRFHVQMIVAPQQAQRSRFQYVHLVRPIHFDFTETFAQIMRIRDDDLIRGTVLHAGW